MSVYAILVYLHIVGALGLFAALAVEWAGLALLRRAATLGQARDGIHLLGLIRRMEPAAALVVLATGIYLGIEHWGLTPWIVAGLVGFVANGVLGGVLNRRRVERLTRAVAPGAGPLAADTQRQLIDPMLQLSAFLRTAIGLGLVFVMSVKPGTTGSVVAMAAAVLLGAVSGRAALATGGRAAAAGSPTIES